jgi:hypothetical protein
MTGSPPDRGPGRRPSVAARPGAALALVAALLAALLGLPGSAAAALDGLRLLPYQARYAIYRNGKLTGKVDVSLERHGERWIIRSEGSGTHGLARILAARDDEDVTGHLREGRFRPDRYQRHTRVAGIDDRWAVEFDWAQRAVSITHDRGDPLVLDMPATDALDPLSLKLEMRRRLSRPNPQSGPQSDPQLHFQMVEEDKIDEQNFRILDPERMETSLGCLRTVVVEKIRENSKRYTRAWHAPELDFIEVRMEHGKTDGNHLEMRITELTVDGVAVQPSPGCAARQAAGDETP